MDDMRAMIDDDLVMAHRARGSIPSVRSSAAPAQNPDVYFQGRETVNPYYDAVPGIVQKNMDKFAKIIGRQYQLFDYVGAPDAERVIVIMGSGAETAHATVDHLVAQGEKVGVLKVRLYRPFSVEHFADGPAQDGQDHRGAGPHQGARCAGEPLYLDCVTALAETGRGNLQSHRRPLRPVQQGIHAGHGQGRLRRMSKPPPKNHFTVGINDDVTHTSLDYDPSFDIESKDTVRAMFYGLGSDGTVGANNNSIKIIGNETDNYAQGYFVYDSKKAGAMTVSTCVSARGPFASPT